MKYASVEKMPEVYSSYVTYTEIYRPDYEVSYAMYSPLYYMGSRHEHWMKLLPGRRDSMVEELQAVKSWNIGGLV